MCKPSRVQTLLFKEVPAVRPLRIIVPLISLLLHANIFSELIDHIPLISSRCLLKNITPSKNRLMSGTLFVRPFLKHPLATHLTENSANYANPQSLKSTCKWIPI